MEQNGYTPEAGQEETTRRRFLKWLLGIIAAVNVFHPARVSQYTQLRS